MNHELRRQNKGALFLLPHAMLDKKPMNNLNFWFVPGNGPCHVHARVVVYETPGIIPLAGVKSNKPGCFKGKNGNNNLSETFPFIRYRDETAIKGVWGPAR